jgi:hypothetical protein
MKLIYCSVFDKVAAAFLQPFPVKRIEEAQRAFMSAVSDPNQPMSEYPDDYILYSIGEFDDQAGELVGYQTGPQRVMTGTDAKKSKATIDKANKETQMEMLYDVEEIKTGGTE